MTNEHGAAKRCRALVLAVMLAGAGCSARASAPSTDAPDRLSALSYTAIVSDSAGVSHFRDGQIPFELEDYAPPAAPLGVSAPTEAENVTFLTYPAGWYGEWHPAPRRLLVFILSGRVEVEVGDGEKRTFGPGDAILAVDTTGRGHIARTAGNGPAVSAAVAVADDAY